jgi:UDP-GlcNAc:undecaprenyl-phosphate GlcNAc-1-phosphate transferase
MKFKLSTVKIYRDFVSRFKNKTFSLLFTGLVFTVFQLVYILLRYKFINDEIPLWYTKLWGDEWLAPKSYLYLIPVVTMGITLFGAVLTLVNKYYIKYFYELIFGSMVVCQLLLTFSIVRIIFSASVPFTPLIDPRFLPLLVPFVVSYFVMYFFLPNFIDFAQKRRLITNPALHSHPGMVLHSPSARGGGFIYGGVFLLLAFIFVGFSKLYFGIYVSVFMISILSFIDDYQNTHPLSSFRVFENPLLRLILLLLSVMPAIFSGVVINEISIPFDGLLILGRIAPFVPLIFTAVWMVWLMNILSWSNGIDGQFSGIVGIASLIVAVLALRFKPLGQEHINIAILATISAGAAFGLVKYNWFPSKIMWGFGAMNAGLIISTLSISARTKIFTSILIILIPFMDAVVTVTRRVLQKKNPLSGDRGHLHHLLLERGWSVQKIARFYWLTTAFFGVFGIVFPERYSIQAVLVVAGLVAFGIILLNVKSTSNKESQLEAVK